MLCEQTERDTDPLRDFSNSTTRPDQSGKINVVKICPLNASGGLSLLQAVGVVGRVFA
ncbi:hypothetical protein J6590_021706 [Homalodisca vitripennis]|nr:hypothetical protein J6590_021706 [Homalodisca vitripennis]